MLSLFTDDISGYVENSKESVHTHTYTHTIPELNKWLQQDARCKINTQNQLYFYMITTLLEETEIKNIYNCSKEKCIGINLMKHIQDLYSENHKILMKERKEYLNKWTNILCSWFGRRSTVKMSIVPRLIAMDLVEL